MIKRRKMQLSGAGLHCAGCNYKGDYIYIHHIIPVGKPGSADAPWNLIPLCKGCHEQIHRDIRLEGKFYESKLAAWKYHQERRVWTKLITRLNMSEKTPGRVATKGHGLTTLHSFCRWLD